MVQAVRDSDRKPLVHVLGDNSQSRPARPSGGKPRAQVGAGLPPLFEPTAIGPIGLPVTTRLQLYLHLTIHLLD